MDAINYHHLHYFYLVAREGSLSRASERLMLAPSTVSGQIRELERSLGGKLFARSGRSLVLTEFGRLVYRYAEEIFEIGRELQDALKGRPAGRPMVLSVGVADAVPKIVARAILEPALRLKEPVRLVCREAQAERLLGELAVHGLDLVLSDTPVSPTVRVRAFNHLLGECGTAFFARNAALARRLRRGFPRSLDGAPVLLPTLNTALRRSLEQWFAQENIRPRIVAEFEDSALLLAFGQAGMGIFPAADVLAPLIERQFRARVAGRTGRVRERFYAISVERRISHPAVSAICQEARKLLFR
ncbi:MAG: transcriptional activator NhaR [Planctomycetota bacterium]|nr:transcriptional activator NhaR [Planctomycetota bacterium]